MEIVQLADNLRKMLKSNSDFNINPIDFGLPIIPPFRGNDKIKLIILGQDPTIKNEASRKNIKYTLNLDKENALKTYLNRICIGLGMTIENVYATNMFKYFYSKPPAETLEVLINHLEPNLKLLQKELTEFDNIPIISLGEPVLQLLTDEKAKVREYWDYNIKTKITNANFKFSDAKNNKLNRDLFPFPHQPSIRKVFYSSTLNFYISFMKNKI